MLNRLKKQIEKALRTCLREVYPDAGSTFPVVLEVPGEKVHGDLACTIALRLAREMKKNPMTIAAAIEECLAAVLKESPLGAMINKVEVKKPGFINLFLSPEAYQGILKELFEHKETYGYSRLNAGQKIQIEFVSANPTGPLSVAHARQAAVGDALASILKATGAAVTREYYVNDEGNQIRLLGESIRCRAFELFGKTRPFPENGYRGDYLRDMAARFCEEQGILDDEALTRTPLEDFSRYGVARLMELIRQDLEDFRVCFDVWTRQSEVAGARKIAPLIDDFGKKGYLYEKENARWFASSRFGDDKDRVVQKSDGTYTYLAPDIVYHKDKFDRGFSKIINIWGPDHHGYIPRIKAAASALGHDVSELEVLIVQLATIYRDGKPVSMSTRRGEYISMREVIDEVGVDAARFFFLMRRIENHLDFDLELAKKESPENPIYYIQYAHARINSVFKLAAERNLTASHTDFGLLREEEEMDLIKKMGFFPDMVQVCARQRDPFTLGVYLQDLAASFHKLYDTHRVVGEDEQLSRQRLALLEAVMIVLAKGLNLLGLHAPESM